MKFAIRVTDGDGHDMFVRHGSEIGEGAVVQFATKSKAQKFAEEMKFGLEDDWTIAIVLYGGPNQDTVLA